MPVDKSGQRVRRMFGEIAGRYDLANHLLSMNVDRYWRWRTIRALADSADGAILDLCTGTGDLALAFYRATPSGTRVVGADFCHEMLVRGQDKGRRAGANGRLSFVEADAMNLPFPDESFGVVSVAFGLRNVSDTDAGLREMVRVCRAGGKVAVLEFSEPGFKPLRLAYGWYFKNVLPKLGQLIARNSSEAYNYLPESVGEFPSGQELARRMREAGLSEVSVRPLTMGVATLYIGRKS